MPTFEVTAPDGQTYDVEGPAGSTQEQALAHFQSQYKPPGAEAQIPRSGGSFPVSKAPTTAEVAGNIGTATGLGAALGAVSPEIVTGVGAAATGIPVIGPIVGPALMTAGRAMRAGRLAEAAAGALSGGVSEAAGQGVEAAGGTPAAGMAARFGAGMLSPGAGAIASFVAKPLKAAVKLVGKLTQDAVLSVPKAVQEARDKLAGGFFSTAPQHDLHAMLKQGADADVAAAKAAAIDLEAKAHARAADLIRTSPEQAAKAIADAKAQGAQLQSEAAARMRALDVATKGKIHTAERVQKMAEPELAKVGGYREVSDIGNDLRGKVTAEQGQAIEARQQQYQQLKAPRDAAVAAKESAGQTLDKEPGMQALKQELHTKLLTTKKGREAAQGMAQVTEGGVMGAYTKVLDTINNRRVQTGVNAEGNPTYETFKTSFEALDHVRRKLGDALKPGADKEGYGALGKDIAQDLYGKIAKIQEDFAGPSQKALQDFYSGATSDMTKFGTASGKKLTAVDRIDPEVFTKDPKAIPGAYFNSQQGVRDLKELTGDPTLVHRAAQDYSVRQLAGKDSKQVAEWLKNPAQSDWMREVPGLQKSIADYGMKLGRIEQTTEGLASRVKGLQSEKARIAGELPKAQEAVMQKGAATAAERVSGAAAAGEKLVAGAQEAGKANVAAVTAQAQKVAHEGFPADEVRGLLMSKNPADMRAATRYLAGTPGGKQALEGSVRNVLSTTAPGELGKVWNERLSVALREGGVLSPKVLAKLDSDVQGVLKRLEPVKARSAVQKLLNAAIVSSGVTGAAGIVNATGGNPRAAGGQ